MHGKKCGFTITGLFSIINLRKLSGIHQLISGIILLSPLVLFAQERQKPLAKLDHALFMEPGGTVYTEIYIRVPGQSLTYHQVDSQHFQSKALINLQVSRKGKIHYSQQYVLESSKVTDTTDVPFVLTDQREVPLDLKGRYMVALKVVDHFQQANRVTIQQSMLHQVTNTGKPRFSDIKLLDTVSRSSGTGRFIEAGYLMRPRASNTLPASRHHAYFYTELYNADRLVAENQPLDVHVTLLHQQDTLFQKKQAFEPKPVIKILGQLQRDKLKQGTHRLLVSTPAEDGKALSTDIQVRNPSTSPSDTVSLREHLADYPKDSLLTFVKWLRTLADRTEARKLQLLEKNPSRDSLLAFMARFWKRRNPYTPKAAWLSFRSDVAHVNHTYSNSLYKGYESARGRVYLQYGEPNTIFRSPDDPNTYPYEIWNYFRTPKQANVRFVFYARSIVEAEYVLLHSDAVGEMTDPQWKEKLDRSPINKENPFGNNPGWDFQK